MIRSLVRYLFFFGIFCLVAGLSAHFTLSYFIETEETVVVPDLIDKNAIAALELLSDLGLNTKVAEMRYHPDIAKHHVIAQNPLPGHRIKVNRDVSLTVSKGTQRVSVPDMAGLKLMQARIALQEEGLTPGRVSYAADSHTPSNQVMAQYPQAGKSLEQGDSISLLVSTGSRAAAYLMPDLTGRYLDQAMLLIETHQMPIESLQSVYDPVKPVNTVTGQAPPAGYRVEAGEPVRLMVNRRKNSDPSENAKKVLFSHRLAPGFLKQRVRLEMNAFGSHMVLFDGLMAPDSLIWAIVPEHTQAAVFLYVNDRLAESQVFD